MFDGGSDFLELFSLFFSATTTLITAIDFGLLFSLGYGSGALISMGIISFLLKIFYDFVLFLIGVFMDYSTFTKLAVLFSIILDAP
jgi:hypothetical protein